MKFKTGDKTDTALCASLKHEFMRCDDAFFEFAATAKIMIVVGENPRIAYKAYNAYARFIHHLYEFHLGAAMRDRLDTEQLKKDMADKYIASYTWRILKNRRDAILNGTAPPWENHISAYPENVPPKFPEEFRKYRNIASGHVKPERAHLSLTDFYERNHKYLYMLYQDAKYWWGRSGEEFPNLEEITAFSVVVKDSDTK